MWWLCFLLLPMLCLPLLLPYYRSAYFRGTHLPFLWVRLHKGAWGEYQLYRAADALPGRKAWLFNLYLPKQDRATTEIDAVLIHESGVYVFESKNLQGTVNGTPTDRDWLLAAPGGKEYLFYNPILQNQTHCDHLSYLAPRALVYSIIVFGDGVTPGELPSAHGIHRICTRKALPSLLRELAARVPHQHSVKHQKNIETVLTPYANASRAARRRHKEILLRQKQRHEGSQSNETDLP